LLLCQEICYSILHLDSEGLIIDVEAPDEAKVNEGFYIELNFRPHGYIYIVSLTVTFSCSGTTIYKETILTEQYIYEEFSKTYLIKTKYPGRIKCTIDAGYRFPTQSSIEGYAEETQLDLTYVTNKTREELENVYWNYTSLKSEYESLKTDYEALYENYSKLYWSYDSCSKYRNYLESEYKKLEENYNSLNEKLQEQYRNTDIFFLTTMIFLASTIYLTWKIRRKEQRKSSEQKEEGLIKR
jgi:hypothetical protein